MGECLASVEELTDDVVVVDAGSQDGTKEQCRERGARVYERGWRGFSEQKNFGNAMAKYDWILSLDADERVTPELGLSIRREWTRGRGSADAYKIRFANYFGEKRIRFGAWNPEWHVRLFDRRKTSWNTDEVHESLRDLKKIRCGQLAGKIQHLTVSGRKELEAKTVRYSGLFQQKLRRLGLTPPWTKVWLNPAWRFIRDFFLRLGALDGGAGWLIALESARYTHLKYRGAQPVGVPRRGALGWPLSAKVLGFLLVGGLSMQRPSGEPAEARPTGPSVSTDVQDNESLGKRTLAERGDDELLTILPADEEDGRFELGGTERSEGDGGSSALKNAAAGRSKR